MTDRLYYTAQRLAEFSAGVVAIENDGYHVILDQTAFYPTSGGQPHDVGSLDAVAVTDVIDSDDRVIHVCDRPFTSPVGSIVRGVVDWDRRFDHMQQHSGQHLLSALLADAYGWPTVSVHFGDVSSTVDVVASDISPAHMETIERQVNLQIVAPHAITVAFVDATTATGLRKPSDRNGELRVVTIEGLDRSACGGTHVSTTGEIGMMLLRRAERTKGNVRLEFICGLRAVAVARRDAQLLNTTARLLTAAPADLPDLIASQQQRASELERERKGLLSALATHEARAIWSSCTENERGVRFVQVPPVLGPIKEAELLVQAVLALGPSVVLAYSPSTGGVMLGASDGSGVNAGITLKALLAQVGGRGGGSPRLAQGTVPGPLDAALVWNSVAAADGSGAPR